MHLEGLISITKIVKTLDSPSVLQANYPDGETEMKPSFTNIYVVHTFLPHFSCGKQGNAISRGVYFWK